MRTIRKLVVLGLVAALGFIAVGEVLEGIRVLGWVKYADVHEEWAHMRDILEAEGAIVSTTETEDPDELLTLLEGVEVVIIPEQEDGWEDEDLLPAGERLAPAFVDFLSQGKRIVSLAYADGGVDLLRGAGLTTADDDADVTEEQLHVVAPEHWLVEGIPPMFRAPDGTTDYVDLDSDAMVIVATASGTPVVFSLPRHGGEIVFLGFDFYESNSATEGLLINVVAVEVPQPIDLQPNVPVSDTLPAGGRTEVMEDQYRLAIPEEAWLVGVQLNGDLDLHIRSERPVEFDDQRTVADISLLSPGGELVVLSTTVLTGDHWLFAVENPMDTEQTYSLVAVPLPTVSVVEEDSYTSRGRIEPPPIAKLVPFTRTDEGMLGLVQYKVDVQGRLEDFEMGDISMPPWRTGGDAPWSVTAAEAHSGLYSAQAGLIGDNESTYLEVTLEVGDGEVSFWYKVSSESGFDYLDFYIDGELMDSWSGEIDWSRASYRVSAGTHTFRWVYTKDGSFSEGADTAWIDEISFPSAARRLRVSLQSPGPVWLHIRHEQPVAVQNGAVVADFTARDLIILSSLEPGSYFVAVEGLQPPQDYEIEIEVY